MKINQRDLIDCSTEPEWFSKFLNLENGIPSHDAFKRLFILIISRKFFYNI